jgi:hypothetical protein
MSQKSSFTGARSVDQSLEIDLSLPKLVLILSASIFKRVVQQFRSSNRSGRKKLVVGELRQLGGAEHGVVAHQERRIDLGISMLSGMQIEHELPERAFKPRQAALEHDKTRAGKLRGGLEIHLAERLAQIEMLLRRESIVALRPKMMVLDIGALVLAIGHFIERQVWDLRERLIELF